MSPKFDAYNREATGLQRRVQLISVFVLLFQYKHVRQRRPEIIASRIRMHDGEVTLGIRSQVETILSHEYICSTFVLQNNFNQNISSSEEPCTRRVCFMQSPEANFQSIIRQILDSDFRILGSHFIDHWQIFWAQVQIVLDKTKRCLNYCFTLTCLCKEVSSRIKTIFAHDHGF